MATRKIKVAFCKNRIGWRNWFVRWWTGSDVVHAEIVLPDNSIIGISPEDTGRVRRTQADFSNPEDNWEFINLEITQQQFKVLLCFFEMTHGMKYDWFGMVTSHITSFYIWKRLSVIS